MAFHVNVDDVDVATIDFTEMLDMENELVNNDNQHSLTSSLSDSRGPQPELHTLSINVPSVPTTDAADQQQYQVLINQILSLHRPDSVNTHNTNSINNETDKESLTFQLSEIEAALLQLTNGLHGSEDDEVTSTTNHQQQIEYQSLIKQLKSLRQPESVNEDVQHHQSQTSTDHAHHQLLSDNEPESLASRLAQIENTLLHLASINNLMQEASTDQPCSVSPPSHSVNSTVDIIQRLETEQIGRGGDDLDTSVVEPPADPPCSNDQSSANNPSETASDEPRVVTRSRFNNIEIRQLLNLPQSEVADYGSFYGDVMGGVFDIVNKALSYAQEGDVI
ncbi:uncharacterized protein LOC128509652 isoform X1 [Clarias gariepinus]|uniref:uncharacterized protein LOC128509652 isoform X1 n=1 Tax=Clarias gariepinus TaxID=13013 RepID=UPI00234DBD2D|nr:uncharacterized protein LOC128509652 isoform X1 [Clarias gariepinus]